MESSYNKFNLDKELIRKNFLRIAKGVVISIFATLILLFIFSLILTFTSVSETTIKPIIIIISIISLLIGSSISTLKINKKGIVNGGIVGISYILIIYILSSIVSNEFNLNLDSLIMIILSVIAGMTGGIIGVNI